MKYTVFGSTGLKVSHSISNSLVKPMQLPQATAM